MRIQWYPTQRHHSPPPPKKKNKALLGTIIKERLMKKPFQKRLRALSPESTKGVPTKIPMILLGPPGVKTP